MMILSVQVWFKLETPRKQPTQQALGFRIWILLIPKGKKVLSEPVTGASV